MSFAPFVEEGDAVTDFEEPAALISFLRNSFAEERQNDISIQDRSNHQLADDRNIEHYRVSDAS